MGIPWGKTNPFSDTRMCFLGLKMLDCQSVEAMKSQVEGCLELWLQASLWEESSSGADDWESSKGMTVESFTNSLWESNLAPSWLEEQPFQLRWFSQLETIHLWWIISNLSFDEFLSEICIWLKNPHSGLSLLPYDYYRLFRPIIVSHHPSLINYHCYHRSYQR